MAPLNVVPRRVGGLPASGGECVSGAFLSCTISLLIKASFQCTPRLNYDLDGRPSEASARSAAQRNSISRFRRRLVVIGSMAAGFFCTCFKRWHIEIRSNCVCVWTSSESIDVRVHPLHPQSQPSRFYSNASYMVPRSNIADKGH